MKKSEIIGCFVFAGIVGGLFWLMCSPVPSEKNTEDAGEIVGKGNRGEIRDTVSTGAATKRSRAEKPVIDTERRTDLSPQDKSRLLAIENAMDAEDLNGLRKVLEDATLSTNAEIRAALVEGLGWFGSEALVELTPFMADQDEDVAEAARNAWEQALSDLKSTRERLNTALMALEAISDKDTLAIIASHFSNAATELIDGPDNEETSRERRTEIVLAVEDVINGGKSASAEAAREVFEDITGHEYVNSSETQLYLSDPDNYESPEDRAEAETAKDDDRAADDIDSGNGSSRSLRSQRRSRRSGSSDSSGTSAESGFDGIYPDDNADSDIEIQDEEIDDDSADFEEEPELEDPEDDEIDSENLKPAADGEPAIGDAHAE